MINWKKYFDHIFCLHYAGHPNKLPRITNELKRVGILDSGIFSFHMNISGPLINRMQQALPLHTAYNQYWKMPGYTNTMLGHYWMLKACQLAKYDRFLILENDIAFLKDLDNIKKILDSTPKDYDIVLYDNVQYFAKTDHNNLGSFTRVQSGTYHNATAYSMHPRYRDLYLLLLEKHLMAIDDLYNRIDKNMYKFYISNVNMCIHKPFGACNNCQSNDDLYIKMGLDLSLYQNV